jgi:hypothetical protein
LIVAKPHLYGTQDYKVGIFLYLILAIRLLVPNLQVVVPPELFDEMEAQWAPQNDPVFELTPPLFTTKIREAYEYLGCPAVSSRNFWDVYCDLLHSIIPVQEELTADIQNYENGSTSPIELIPGQEELREGVNVVAGYEYYGGVPNFPPHPEAHDTNGDESVEDHRAYADLTDVESS